MLLDLRRRLVHVHQARQDRAEARECTNARARTRAHAAPTLPDVFQEIEAQGQGMVEQRRPKLCVQVARRTCTQHGTRRVETRLATSRVQAYAPSARSSVANLRCSARRDPSTSSSLCHAMSMALAYL